MKKNIFCILLAVIVSGQFSCKKFLDVVPIERLSGNQYWKSGNDVEAFINDIYGTLWTKLTAASFIPATGEQRLSEIRTSASGRFNTNDAARRAVYNVLATNDIKSAVETTRSWNTGTGSNTAFNLPNITKWNEFYIAVQACNILYQNVQNGVPGLGTDETNRYLAEAVYIRSLVYFMMIRIYGDVPYYTDAYHSTAIGRENFVSVLNKCIVELKTVKDFLPWKFDDPAFNGVRANRGGAIALLMNMNMWNAGFDGANKAKYYLETATLGNEIIQSRQYRLLPLDLFNSVMLGSTDEGLIEIKQSINSSTTYNKAAFPGEPMLAYPNKLNTSNDLYSHAYYTSAYMHQLFDADPTDQRINKWFANIFSQDGIFELTKFAGPLAPIGIPDWGLILSRYGDVILLRAEALAEIGQDGESIQALNLIRERANARLYDPALEPNLKDAIYLERCKELIGEGYHFFDLIRTKRVLDQKWCSNPLTQVQFDNGAWTWPIDASAKNRNPFMVLNEYWQ